MSIGTTTGKITGWYVGASIALAVVGGGSLAISGTGFLAKSVGTGAGAAVGSAPQGAAAFQDALNKARANKGTPTAAPATKAPKVPKVSTEARAR